MARMFCPLNKRKLIYVNFDKMRKLLSKKWQ